VLLSAEELQRLSGGGKTGYPANPAVPPAPGHNVKKP
jgi:hypothetical protein